MKKGVEKHIWKILCALLLVAMVLLIFRNRALTKEIEAFAKEQESYGIEEGKSYIVKRISEQMEDIAKQQKDISDQQRLEAVQQMKYAEQMRVRAEKNENKAKEEQLKVQRYAQNLEVARNEAEVARINAVENQHLAETARNRADTLSRISLARSLASTSLIQYQLGNYDISGLLAYRAWCLMKENNGNVFHPIVYDALSKNSESSLSRKIHKGGVMRILPCLKHSEGYVSVSKYGEISRWYRNSNRLELEPLFRDSTYSFRDAIIDEDAKIYALDFNGRLVVVNEGGGARTIELPENRGWMRVCPLNPQLLLLVSSNQLYFYNKQTGLIDRNLDLKQEISALGEKDGKWLVFGKNGALWSLNPQGELIDEKLEINEVVTAYVWSEQLKLSALGTESGNIYLLDEYGKVQEKLVGHRSKVTQLDFSKDNLYSSSYDCNINIWNMKTPKKEALSLMQVSSWIYCFYLSDNHSVWIGDESGLVYRILISPDDMAALVKRNLKRDFTNDEWMYYFGTDIPRMRLNRIGE